MLSSSLRLTAANRAALETGAARVVVIGPSGWLGSAACAMLDRALSSEEVQRRLVLFGSHARPVVLPSGASLACRPCADLASCDLAECVILHFGYLTKDRARGMAVEDYVRANDAIQDAVIQGLRATSPRALFFASSGAVYQGAVPGRPGKDENLYGWMKRKHEGALGEAAERAGTAFVNGRIFTLAGEYINKTTLYALASLLCDLQAERPITINAAHPVWRSYTYVGDVINLALTLMLTPRQPVLSFDIAGAEAVEIGQLATLCAEAVGKEGTAILRPEVPADSVADRMIGDGETFYALMKQAAIDPLPLTRQIAVTASYLGSQRFVS